jgi:hypothetical protein
MSSKLEEIQDWIEQAQKIMEESDCLGSLEDECLKLYCLLTRCSHNLVHNGEEMLSRQYVISKASRLLQGIPIILDQDGKRMFASLKLKSNKGLPPQKEGQ